MLFQEEFEQTNLLFSYVQHLFGKRLQILRLRNANPTRDNITSHSASDPGSQNRRGVSGRKSAKRKKLLVKLLFAVHVRQCELSFGQFELFSTISFLISSTSR